VSGRARIAIVVDRIHDYQVPVIRGVESVVHAAGAALLVVISHPQHSRQDTTLRRLVRAGHLDGVVLTAIRDVDTRKNHRVADLAELAEGVPRVTIGVRLPGIPVVLSENRGGIRAAMLHLLDDCNRRRPLLMAGVVDNDDSRERVDAFLEIARERNLDLPDSAVAYAHFEREHAYRATLERLDGPRQFDAVLASNDDMAMGVLDALNERHVRIPDDVAVVGFDNLDESYLTNPPLTSVDIELEAQGKAAAALVLAQLRGEEVENDVRPTANLVVRLSSSLGANEKLSQTALADLARPLPGERVRGPDAGPRPERVLSALATVTADVDEDFQKRLQVMCLEWVPPIMQGRLDAERAERVGGELMELVQAHPEPLWWRDLVATLQAVLARTSPGGEISPVVQAGLLRLTLQIERALAAVREHRDREVLALSENVLELNRALSGCQSFEALTREVAAYLPRLNIGRCFIVLLEKHIDRRPDEPAARDDSGMACLVMSFRDGAMDPAPDETRFSIDDLLPPALADELQHGTLTVQPLFTADRWFGTVLHEQSTIDRHTGEALRLDTSRVLDTIARAKELTERASELQALVAMRTEQLELEVASRRSAQESLHEANLELRRALLLDGLTGLQNRPSFDEHLTRAWHQHLRGREPLSVLMVDVDHFKLFNDTYGHLAGDTCLRQVAGCLQAAVTRKQDTVARFGGEEFAIVLPDTDVHGARQVARRILGGLRAAAIPHEGSDHGQVSVSIGIGTTTDGRVTSVGDLLESADRALYAAKHGGRDRVEESPSSSSV
jgi:diguanylate cyclase (GGDEF)-like protein